MKRRSCTCGPARNAVMDRALFTPSRVIAVAIMAISALALFFWIQHVDAHLFGDMAWYAKALPALLSDEPLYDPVTLRPHPMVAPEYWNQAPSLAPFVLTILISPWIWIAASVGSVVAGLVLIWPRMSPAATLTLIALLLLTEPMRAALWSANVNAMVFGLLAVALRFPRIAGWSIGLAAALKLVPILGVAWLIGKRDWRGSFIAVGVLTAFTLITVGLKGPTVIPDFVIQRLNEYDPHLAGKVSIYAFGFAPWVGLCRGGHSVGAGRALRVLQPGGDRHARQRPDPTQPLLDVAAGAAAGHLGAVAGGARSPP